MVILVSPRATCWPELSGARDSPLPLPLPLAMVTATLAAAGMRRHPSRWRARRLLTATLLGTAAAGHLAPCAATGKMPMPFAYKGFEKFPASFFGADIWGARRRTTPALEPRHSGTRSG